MSIDHYYAKRDGKWKNMNAEDVEDERADVREDFWVDICHGGAYLVDERYYFPDMASALDFYLDGWKGRQYLDENGRPCGIDHSGLYSRGRLIHGLSIHCETPGHEGERVRQICELVMREMDEEEEEED